MMLRAVGVLEAEKRYPARQRYREQQDAPTGSEGDPATRPGRCRCGGLTRQPRRAESPFSESRRPGRRAGLTRAERARSK
jgi:hypothetical protein